RRSKNTGPDGIFMRIQAGCRGRGGAASEGTPSPSTGNLRERGSITRRTSEISLIFPPMSMWAPGPRGMLVAMWPTVVVGDVPGCLDELRDLLDACGYTRGDRLVLAGDLTVKGPDSAGVVALARAEGALAVLGNHDDHVLAARAR